MIGQCTLHWGRMEFGNIGNYYILEPLIRQLHETFPGCTLKTTYQLSDRFCKDENVSVLPMDVYYGWDDDLGKALKELGIAQAFNSTGKLFQRTPYVDAVMAADLVIDFSGDIWGENADFLGPDRFLVGLIKDRVAQLLGKRTAMIAGSPGPFKEGATLKFAREVFAQFDLVTNREPMSRKILLDAGFDLSSTHDLACPSFLFKGAGAANVPDPVIEGDAPVKEGPTIGFIVCGWNFEEGPFDKWPRSDEEYLVFAETVEYLENECGANVCLMSHSNGFPIPPEPFKLIHGRDYPVIKQLQTVLEKRGRTKRVFALDGVYDAWTTKALIGKFDMLVSGRVHAAVAALSQTVPTVIMDYGHEPKAHKLLGFAESTGVKDLVADPSKPGELKDAVSRCWSSKKRIHDELKVRIPKVQELARHNFTLLRELMGA